MSTRKVASAEIERQLKADANNPEAWEKATTVVPELTAKQMASAIPGRLRKRLMLGHFESGADIPRFGVLWD
jgi:hypothetical protein